MKSKINVFLENTSYLYLILQYVFIIAYITFMVLPFPILLGFYITVPFLNIVLYIIYKDYMSNKKLSWYIFLAQVTLFFMSLPLYIIKCIEANAHIKVVAPVKIIFALIALVFTFALLLTDAKNKEEKMNEISLKKRLGGGDGAVTDSDHDVTICKDKETGDDIFIKWLDRFLHLLILGPTGCGKTSQILIPMLLQDIRKGHGVIVLEPKSDFAILGYAMCVYYKKEGLYFNPTDPDCPRFNPLDDKESVVIENITTIFEMLTPDSMTYYKDLANNLLRNAIRVLKRMEAAYMNYETGVSQRPARLLELNDILQNTNNRGRKTITEFLKIPAVTPEEKKENEDIARYFIDNYYADRSIVWQNTSGVRTQVANLINNEYLKRVLNPENGKSDINFRDIVESGKRIFITTNQGALQNLNKYLGYFFMFTIQAAILGRSGNENTRIPCYLYLDEFQTYANKGLSTILQQGRSYRVSAILATQSRNAIKLDLGQSGEAFLSVVQTNARSQVLFPGLDPDDAKYYSVAFGEEKQKEIQKGITRQKFEIGHGFKELNYPSEQERYIEKDMARFTSTQLTEMNKNEIAIRRVLDNEVTVARYGISSYIDNDINAELHRIADEHIEIQNAKREEFEKQLYEAKRQLYTDYQAGKKSGYGSMGSNTAILNNPSVDSDGMIPDDLDEGTLSGSGKGIQIE